MWLSVFKRSFERDILFFSQNTYHVVKNENILENFIHLLLRSSNLFTINLFTKNIWNHQVSYNNDLQRGYIEIHWIEGQSFHGKCYTLLKDLSKAFECTSHVLIIAKLYSYGFTLPALNIMNNHLTNRKQRTKINKAFSSWKDIICGVHQKSILALHKNEVSCKGFLQ